MRGSSATPEEFDVDLLDPEVLGEKGGTYREP